MNNSGLFIDAAKECIKVTNANKLTANNISNIIKLYTDRCDIEHVCSVVSNEEIGNSDNKYDLQVSTYVQPEEEPPIDIKEVNAEISRSSKRISELQEAIEALIARIEA